MPLPENLDPAAVHREFSEAQQQMLNAFAQLPPPKQHQVVEAGRTAFFRFLQSWMEGLHPTTLAVQAEVQPDRQEMLKNLQRGSTSFQVLMYVLSRRNLQSACLPYTKGDRTTACRLAESVGMPASLLFADLAHTLSASSDPFAHIEQKQEQS